MDELLGRAIPKRRVRSLSAVIETPDLDGLSSFGGRFERLLIEAFVAEHAVEAFDESVLRWLARRNMTRLVSSVPLSRTIVLGNPRILPSIVSARVTRSPESDVSLDHKRFVRVVVDDRERADPTTRS